MTDPDLKLVKASENRNDGEWKEDDFDVVHVPTGRAVGVSSYGERWWWGLHSDYAGASPPFYGTEESKEDAKQKFAEVWRSYPDRSRRELKAASRAGSRSIGFPGS